MTLMKLHIYIDSQRFVLYMLRSSGCWEVSRFSPPITHLAAGAMPNDVDEDELVDAGHRLGQRQTHHRVGIGPAFAQLAAPGGNGWS